MACRERINTELYGLFQQLDADGNGGVTWNEWYRGMSGRMNASESQLRQAFKNLDINGDEVISWEELKGRIYYHASKTSDGSLNSALNNLVFAEVAQRTQRKLQKEQKQHHRHQKAANHLKGKCDELAQFLKDVSTSLRLTYTLPSPPPSQTPTPGATPGRGYATDNGATDDGSGKYITRGHVSGTSAGLKTICRASGMGLSQARKNHGKSKSDAQHFRQLYKKLLRDKRNMDEILDFHNCEAEPLPTTVEDDDAYTNGGQGSGPPGLNITNVDYERKIITLQNTQGNTLNAGDYHLHAGSAGTFQLPRRGLWPKGQQGDKLEIGLGGNLNLHGVELFWADVLNARLASSSLQLKLGSQTVGRAIPGYKLARQTNEQQRNNYAVTTGRYMPPEPDDRVKIRTTIGTDTKDAPIYKWVNGTVQEVFPEQKKALVKYKVDGAVRYVNISPETLRVM